MNVESVYRVLDSPLTLLARIPVCTGVCKKVHVSFAGWQTCVPPCWWPCSTFWTLQCLTKRVLGPAVNVLLRMNRNWCRGRVVFPESCCQKHLPLYITNLLFHWRCSCTVLAFSLHLLKSNPIFGAWRAGSRIPPTVYAQSVKLRCTIEILWYLNPWYLTPWYHKNRSEQSYLMVFSTIW